jgi:hypothetical protein
VSDWSHGLADATAVVAEIHTPTSPPAPLLLSASLSLLSKRRPQCNWWEAVSVTVEGTDQGAFEGEPDIR